MADNLKAYGLCKYVCRTDIMLSNSSRQQDLKRDLRRWLKVFQDVLGC